MTDFKSILDAFLLSNNLGIVTSANGGEISWHVWHFTNNDHIEANDEKDAYDLALEYSKEVIFKTRLLTEAPELFQNEN